MAPNKRRDPLSISPRWSRFILMDGILLTDAYPLVLIVLFAVQCLFSLAACCRLVACIVPGLRPDVACRWTDLLGAAVGAVAAPVMLFLVYEAMEY